MGDVEESSAGSDYETQVGDVSGAVHTGHGDIIHIEKVELAATRAADTLRRVLSADEEMRAQFLEAFQQLSELQAQLGEWKELHHILHEVLTSFSPFYANLRALGHTDARPTNGRALLRGWRPCQTEVDRLMDFESSVEHIQLSPRREGAINSRPDWGARIASLRREVEDRLREERWNTEGLIDLADEFSQACDCYLSLADRELRRAVEKVQRLYTHLLGGLM
ncbi:MAG: hypothetical protein SXV54_20055 [Chloroflexota bacterium]|nr:hypothetical protein [Chloroflexota bacterium]